MTRSNMYRVVQVRQPFLILSLAEDPLQIEALVLNDIDLQTQSHHKQAAQQFK